MNSTYRKTYVIALVAVMLLASIPFTISIYDGNSDAADTTDYTRWFYNQLDEPMKYAYDELLNADVTSTEVVITIPSDVCADYYDDCIDEESAKLDKAIEKLINCIHIERPDTYCYELNFKPSATGTTVNEISVKFTIEDADTAMKNQAVKDAVVAIGATGTVIEKITTIHDYLVETLSYATEELEIEIETGITNHAIRSQYKGLVGDHHVVCEGYAKSFKVACDYYGIPCLLISGDALADGKIESHMWNLVYAEGAWYTVDVTWDDPIGGGGKIYDTYLLVGQNTVDDQGLTIAESHSLSRVTETWGFVLPAPLATNKYGGDLVTISFETNGGTAIEPITIDTGTVPTIPTTTRSGYTFEGWYLDSGLTTRWDNTPISSDRSLYAEWTSDSSGGIVDAFNDFLKKVGDFMNDEAIDGVKNLYLVIGGVILFLAIAAIAMRRQ